MMTNTITGLEGQVGDMRRLVQDKEDALKLLNRDLEQSQVRRVYAAAAGAAFLVIVVCFAKASFQGGPPLAAQPGSGPEADAGADAV